MRLLIRILFWLGLFAIILQIHAVNHEILGLYRGANKQYGQLDNLIKGIVGPLIGASIGAFLAWLALKTNAAVSIRNKRIDTILHCNTRYDALYETRKTIEASYATNRLIGRKANYRTSAYISSSDPQVRSYFRRYWGLKSDQLDYWLAGYVDPETLASWFLSTVDLLNDGNPVGYVRATDNSPQIRLSDSIEEMRTSHQTANERLTELVEFIQRYVVHISNADARYAALLHYFRIIERNERGLIFRLTRNNFKRFSVSSFSYVLLEKDNEQYVNLSTQNKLKTIFRKSVVQFGKFIELSEAFVTFSLHDNRRYLQKSIENHPDFVKPTEFQSVIINSFTENINTPLSLKKYFVDFTDWFQYFE